MSDPVGTGYDWQTDPNDPEAINQDIEDTRERLRETVDEIGHRLDVRARAKDAVRDARQRANAMAAQAGAYGRTSSEVVRRGVAAVFVVVVVLLVCRRWSRRSDDRPSGCPTTPRLE